MTATVMTGIAVTFDTGFLAEIQSVDWSGQERAVLETSHAGTTSWRTFTPGLLTNPGTLSVGLWFIPGTSPPWNDAAESVTVTMPDAGAATWQAQGFMFGFSLDGTLEELMNATAELQFSGAITITP